MPLPRLALAAILLLAACKGSTDPSEALVSEVTLNRTSLVPGETMQIRVTVSNPTSRTITAWGSSSCFAVFNVLDLDGAVAYFPNHVCTDDLAPRTFAPHASENFDFTWTGQKQVMHEGHWLTQPIPPGTYQMIGGLGSFTPKGPPSPPVQFEILAAPPATLRSQ